MATSKSIIRHTQNLDVGSNEYATKYSVNRILNWLLENDKLLEDFYREVFGSFLIYEYQPNETYYYNDLVWFMSGDREPYILRCIKSEVKSDLSQWSKGQAFENYGWKDLNPDVNILNEFGLEKKMSAWIAKKFKAHQDDESMHPLGRMSYGMKKPSTDITTKVALRDMSNLDGSREQTFFPYQTTYLKTRELSPIIDGYCRKYDNGLLEYDIVFRLSYAGVAEVDEDYGISATIVNCNSLDLANAHDDEKYFYAVNDTEIFNNKNANESKEESEIGDTRQRARNDFVNVYHATIDFSTAASNIDTPNPKFMNADSYMIFSGDIMCQTRDATTQTIEVGANQMIFTQKRAGSFVAMLVTYPNQKFSTSGYNAKNGGIEANSFHCTLVGRWK